MNDVEIKNKTIIRTFVLIVLIIIFTVVVMYSLKKFNFANKEYYKASDFHIKTVYSSMDYDNDALDDYSDFVLGARKDAENHPKYVSLYYEGGYPPENEGVCTDVIWRAFKNAGYSLKDMVNQDIELYPEDYKDVGKPDPNIDFRRVHNLRVFFNKYAISLTLDPSKIAAFFLGPKIRSPLASKASTIPPTKGSSIPMIVSPILFCSAKSASLSNSIAVISTHSAIPAIPPLPGAQ